jgi:hypothetical protein
MSSCTPCDWSGTVSLSGQRVAATRRFRSARSSSEALNWKGWIDAASAAALDFDESMLMAPMAAAVIKTSRRVGDGKRADMGPSCANPSRIAADIDGCFVVTRPKCAAAIVEAS